MEPRVRPPAVAGSWYPGDARRLTAELELYLERVSLDEVRPKGKPLGLVSPHAGLAYSGPVAAWGYSLLRGMRDVVAVLVGPSHHHAFPGVALADASGFETPLGVVPLDAEIGESLEEWGPFISRNPLPHRDEHCLEMQLPFLQHMIPGLRIVPLLMGSQSVGDVERLGRLLGDALRERSDVLLVASSDLSHYQPATVAHRLDSLVVGDIERFDEGALLARLESTHGHACGGGPIVCVMMAARSLGADHACILRYGDSGEAGAQDASRVVGYVSAALLAQGEAA
jgi:AmmeMemoRadiSam system protein B